jgi:beta-glucosidase
MKIKFPKNFMWGAATSAYQVEGGIVNDWTPHFDAKDATRHYQYFKRDFEMAKKLSHNTHRFSIEWSRIEPEEGNFVPEELAHYEKVIDELHRQGVEPIITLHHFTNPQWFAKKGGWANAQAPQYFKRYVDFVFSNLGSKARFWITINEPMVYIAKLYFEPKPRRLIKNQTPLNAVNSIRNLIKGHCLAYELMHSEKTSVQVGIAKNNTFYQSADKNPINLLIKIISDYFDNQYFLNQIRNHQDFIGLNYYFRNRIKLGFNKNENREISDMGWEIYPEGIYHVLKQLKHYSKPIIITENGLADKKDKKREKFIKQHLYWMYKAMNEGVDVRGYLHWSLLDNFEWQDGSKPRFGLVEVDYTTYRRKIRKSALEYAKICKTNQLTVNKPK